MNYETHYQTLVAHFVKLAKNPGAIDYARHEVLKLAKEWPEMYGQLPKDVARALNERTNPTLATESPKP